MIFMVKVMREFIKKHENIKVFLLLFIPVIVFTSFLIVIDGDEMYNFQSVSKMANGYTIVILSLSNNGAALL